ncbi:MAG: hypothetical protein PVF15_10500 [Candidatus Bathyarchaeota archaeon]
MNEEGTLLKKIIVSIGLVLLAVGAVILVFPAQEPHFEISTAKTWDLQSKILEPQNGTFYGSLMDSDRLFQLNISSSGPVKLTLSIVRHLGDPSKTPISPYPQTRSSFNEKVEIGSTGTYYIDIENENSFPVTLSGNVLVQEKEENQQTIYPYVIPGFLLVLGGVGALIFGIFRGKPKKLPRSRNVTKRKTKSE